MKIGIVGLGVMGASFAKRLHSKHTIYGFDLDQNTLDQAIEQGIIHKGTNQPQSLLDQCDRVILCLYPTQIKPWIETYQAYLSKSCILMEISGVKSGITIPIQESIHQNELISIHPMCGRESRGIAYSQGEIFNQSNFIIVPTKYNTPHGIEAAKTLASELEVGHVAILSIEEHDRMIGFLSQLTHVIAVSLMNTHENSHLVEFTGDSFRDLTRIASINEDLWSELFLLNKDILLDETNQFIDSVTHFRDVLQKEDTDEMKRLFIQSTKRREYFKANDKKGR